MSKVYAFTGHRPDKLGGYGQTTEVLLIQFATMLMEVLAPKGVIVGMAQGWDQAVAYAAIQYKKKNKAAMDVIAAVPFAGFEQKWPYASQERYKKILARCDEMHYISDPPYHPSKFHKRNEWMVDHAEHLIALHNGESGGTHACVSYAVSHHIPVDNVWNEYIKYRTMRGYPALYPSHN